ncbi:uncharacterized protein LOC135207305 isoform X3 [Macrobrachium nipponense]|uniref:uncharacterized protein LOC135207305 isoform X3 n=1 Tax=Macrobrachium nipponense TaxID=159736 RepID=UPI0030C7D06F
MSKLLQSIPRCLTRKPVIVASLFMAAIFVVWPHFDKDVAVGLIALKPWSSEVCVMGLEQKRRLATTIADVHREINRLSGTQGLIDAKWSVKLAGIIEELDPRVTVDDGPWQQEELPPRAEGKSTLPQTKRRHVCPEIIRKFRAMMDKLTRNIVQFAKRSNVRYQLTWGSALGAVKMSRRIPWDFDTDVWYDCEDFDKWQTFPDTPEGKGCSLTVVDRMYFSIHCQGYFVDMGCYETKIDGLEFLPKGYQNIPTTIYHSGYDFVVPPNPGLFVRNCIGLGDLKHKAHWRTKKIVDLTSKKDDAHYNPSPWNYCSDPSHHSCLMHFPTDGNLPFTDPFLHV